MPLRLSDKKQIVAELSEIAANSTSAVVAVNQGLSVADITRLREQGRKANLFLKVVKNTLASRAVEGTSFVELQKILVGPVILAFSESEPSAPAKLFKEFLKTTDKVAVKGIVVSGAFIEGKDIDRIASLPTKDEAISMLMSVMKAPISKLVRTMAEPTAKFVRTVAAVKDKKQSS